LDRENEKPVGFDGRAQKRPGKAPRFDLVRQSHNQQQLATLPVQG
jgi:hypothetical protein